MDSTQDRIARKQEEHGRFRFFRDFGFGVGRGWREGRTNDHIKPGTKRLLIGLAELAVIIAIMAYAITRHS
jgi:hypothetical protein